MSPLTALLGWFAGAAAATTAIRFCLLGIAGRLPNYAKAPRPAVIVGGGAEAAHLLHHLSAVPDHQFEVLGFFDDRLELPGSLHGALPFLGDTGELVEFLSENSVKDVFVAIPWSTGPRITAVLDPLRFLPVTVRLLPEYLPAAALPSSARYSLAGVVMPTLMVPPFTVVDRISKRLFDVVIALLLLVVLLPLGLVIAALIKLDSPGPVLFRQTRTGQFNHSFRIFKFRSLHVLQADPAAETLVTAGDRRITRIGRFLRSHSLDELPQLLNVLAGDMSLVGPRPHASRAKADGRVYMDVMPDYLLRYRAKPGMTGWAQVNGWRGNTDTVTKLHRRVEYDFHYIQRWSMTFDLYILLRTIPSVFIPAAEP